MTILTQNSLRSNVVLAKIDKRSIENNFPFEIISDIAEIESWRKEIYRPIYHIHKWWAQRLGSIFRAAIISATLPEDSSIRDLFYQPVTLPDIVVFDPFMGSGTTIGEAHKLGCTVIGRDINPVAYRAVRTALGPINRREIKESFNILSRDVAPKLCDLYRSLDSDGNPCDVLYYFWVKYLLCPNCGESVDLFSKFVFARHAYVKRNPSIHVVCPNCDAVFESEYNIKEVTCLECGLKFDPHRGWAKRTTATCKHCKHEFQIAKTAREAGHPPFHRMYAKIVLRKDGKKEYLRITQEDRKRFTAAKYQLKLLDPPLPRVKIQEGYNTHQILNYGYRYWDELFNERQLLALATLAQAIHKLPESTARDALETLFSGVLEFNNMFTSYKGEGTGAVRHMFSHHILKPERTPIEANLWGTSKSSGAFSTLYKSRLMRMLDYRESPFEIAVEYTGKRKKKSHKIFGLSKPIGGEIVDSYPKNGLKPGSIYLSCGSSTKIDIPSCCVDLVVTDPPFFDNVHYSELADFFYVWQELYFKKGNTTSASTTRHKEEVQDADANSFAKKLRDVFIECHRVLRDEGLLVFSYHHSREEGWSAIAQAVLGGGFSLVQSQPVKSEMSVAAPKSLATEPIDLDVLLVCRKRIKDERRYTTGIKALERAEIQTIEKIRRFNCVERYLSRNDVRVVLLSQFLVELSPGRNEEEIVVDLNKLLSETRTLVERIWAGQKRQKPAEMQTTFGNF